MAIVRDLSTAQLTFQIAGGTPDDFFVARFRGTEGLSQLYRFEIEVVANVEEVLFDDIVGKAAVLSINTSTGTRYFHGLVARLELIDDATSHTLYRVEMVPTLWLLSHRHRSRIFQDMTVVDIVKKVMEDAGIAADRMRFSDVTGSASTAQRIYCVQYRETDYQFICRLLEEEGVWWRFEQTIDGHTFVAADSASAYVPIEGESTELPYQPPSGMKVEEEHVYRFRLGQSVRPGVVRLTDFNFTNPPLSLAAECSSGRDAGLEFFDYPGGYQQQADGSSIAKTRMEEFEALRIVGVGQSNSPRLSPASKFSLTEHPLTGVSGEYVITSITHQGRQSVAQTAQATVDRGSLLDASTQSALNAAKTNENPVIRQLATALMQVAAGVRGGDATSNRMVTYWLCYGGRLVTDPALAAAALGASPLDSLTVPNLLEDVAPSAELESAAAEYQCRFECIPAAVTYRPPRVTPRPDAPPTQTARVVGPSGEEIHTDEYGRVKVQFHWDREGKFDDHSSCWIRCSQAFAGSGYGMVFLPRVGQEVIVGFLDDNINEPVVIGRLYNQDHMPPYGLPGEKTKSVIKSSSSPGGEGSNEIRFEDAKDSEQILIYGQKDLHLRVKNDSVSNIEANEHITVGDSRYEKIKKDYHLKLEEGSIKHEVGKDLSQKVKGKVSLETTGTHSLKVNGDVVQDFKANCKTEVTSTLALKGASVKIEADSGIELKCGGSSIVLTSAAIFIVGGPNVMINSGSGPPVGPVTAGVTAPEAPEDPAVADEVEFGKDKVYSGGQDQSATEAPESLAGDTYELSELPDQPPTSWIDIKLVDEEGNPCPGEKYVVIEPDGTEHEGTLDSNGYARERVKTPGECQIKWPNLDQTAVDQQT